MPGGLSGVTSAIRDLKLEPKTAIPAKMVFVSPSGEFCCQLRRNDNLVDNIMRVLSRSATCLLTPAKRKVGSLCCVHFFEYGSWTWYRAVVLEERSGGATVYFVDYGDIEDIDNEHIYELPARLASIAAQAVRCRLAGIVESVSAADFVERLEELANKFMTLVVQVRNPDGLHLVDMVFPTIPSVREQFIEERLVLAKPGAKTLRRCLNCSKLFWSPRDDEIEDGTV